MSGAVLVAEGVTVRFGALTAVGGVDLAVHRGEAVGLIGPNGAGKSTFFNAITGYIPYTEGSLTVNGKQVIGREPWAIASAGVIRTFQNGSVFPGLSVEENLVIAHRRRRASGDRSGHGEGLAAVVAELEAFVLTAGARTTAGELAYGQQRYLSVAMALAAAPEYLLLDEPAAGLNASESTVVADVLREARRAGVGIVVVEHDMSFLMPLVDSVFVLDAGMLIAAGTPTEVQADPAVRAAYLGGPAEDA